MPIIQTTLLGKADGVLDRRSAERLPKISLLAYFDNKNVEFKR
jgi:hypothetical protein